jgi:hypothetical protein
MVVRTGSVISISLLFLTPWCHLLFYSIYILRCTLKLNSSTDSSLRYFSFKTQHGLSQFFNNSSVRFPANENFRKKKQYFANFLFVFRKRFLEILRFLQKCIFGREAKTMRNFVKKNLRQFYLRKISGLAHLARNSSQVSAKYKRENLRKSETTKILLNSNTVNMADCGAFYTGSYLKGLNA